MKRVKIKNYIISLCFYSFSLQALALGGGQYANIYEYQSVVKFLFGDKKSIRGFCSATKIAEKWFITSAHCGFINKKTGAISNMLAVDSRIIIENSKGEIEYHTIEKAVPHFTYQDLAKKLSLKNKLYGGDGLALKSFDIAMFKIRKKTPYISISPISFDDPSPYDELILAGYGGENTIETKSITELFNLKKEKYKLKYGPTIVLEPRDEFLQKSSEFKFNPLALKNYNFITAGSIFDEGFVSLKGGDSGGPCFKIINGVAHIISVNSYVLGRETKGNFANVHPKLSLVKSWVLENLKL